MYRYLVTISFDGTSYHGWQVQPNGITVQEEIQNAFYKMLKTRPDITGCSRTDSGVHAIEFCFHFDLNTFIEPSGIISGLNSVLPKDIRVINCRTVNSDFHARYSCVGKTYKYYIDVSPVQSPFFAKYSLHYPYHLDIDLMNEFCKSIIGTHDFIGFSAAKRSTKDTVRTISECYVEKKDNFIVLTVTADGFLYNMVRIIVGTAIEAGKSKIKDFDAIINSKSRKLAGDTAKPHGLYLAKVYY